MPTVGSLAYAVLADTSKLTAGVAASRSELKELKAAFESTRTPVERFTADIERLQALAEKFPASAAVMQQRIGQIRDQMFKAAQTPLPERIDLVSLRMSKLQLVLDPVSLAFQALRMGADLAHTALDKIEQIAGAVADRMERLDEIAKRARLLGVAEESIIGLGAAAKDLAGVDIEQFDRGFLEFTKHIAQAAMSGKGEAFDAFDRLGLSVHELAQMSPDKALLRTADALQNVDNAAERLNLADALVGGKNAPLAAMLAAGADEIERIADTANRLQQTRFINFEDIEQANDAMSRLRSLFDGILGQLGSGFAPLIKDVTDDLTKGFSNATNDGEKLRDVIDDMAIATAFLFDEWETLNELLSSPTGSETLERTFQQITGMGPMLEMVKGLLGNAVETTAQDPTSRVAKLLEAQNRVREGREGGTIADIAEKAAKERGHLTVGSPPDQHSTEMLLKERKEIIALEEKRAQSEMRANKEQMEKEERVVRETRTPAEELIGKFAELRGLRLDPDTRRRALEGLHDDTLDIRDKATFHGPQSIGGIRAGSVEALRAQFEPRSAQDKLLKTAEKQHKEMELATQLLGQIKDEIGKIGLAEAP